MLRPCPHHSHLQRPRPFWSAPRIATSGPISSPEPLIRQDKVNEDSRDEIASCHVQHLKSAIHGLPVTLRMLRVKPDKSDWFWSQSTVFTKPFRPGMSLDRAKNRDSWCRPKGARSLGARMCPHVSGYFFFRKYYFADTKIFASTRRVFESFSAVHTYPIVSGNFLICSSAQFFCRRES